MKKITLSLFSLALITAIIIVSINNHFANAQLGGAAYNTTPSFTIASSSTFTISQTSTQILASSTPTRRDAATIQSMKCTTLGTLFLNTNGDQTATPDKGMAITASSTRDLEDYPNTPVVQGAIRAVVDSGTCTVLVTEWRSQF